MSWIVGREPGMQTGGTAMRSGYRSLGAASLALALGLWACGGDDDDGPVKPGELAMQGHLSLESLIGHTATGAGNWGYTAPGGRRLALTGTSFGTSVVDVTDPRNPRKIALIEGEPSL